MHVWTKIIPDFGFSALAYCFVGYWLADDVTFSQTLAAGQDYQRVKCCCLMAFFAAIAAIVCDGIAER